MSQLTKIPTQLFRTFRRSIQSELSFRRLNYSQKPDEPIKVSRKSKFLFVGVFGVAATAFAYYVQKEKEYGKYSFASKLCGQHQLEPNCELVFSLDERTRKSFEKSSCWW